MNKIILPIAVVSSLLFSVPASALSFDFLGFNGFSEASNPDEWAALERAGDTLSDLFYDNITVNIDVGYADLDPSDALATTYVETMSSQYSEVKDALIADAVSAVDIIAIANLPDGPNLSFLTNAPVSGNIIEESGSVAPINNYRHELDIASANAKALGIIPNDEYLDGEIAYNSNSSILFDFDASDGISSNMYDFEGLMVHELLHALGFFSGVDFIDRASEPNGEDGVAPTDLSGFRIFNTLDLFRYSTESRNAGVDFDFAVGNAPYFSVDKGVNNLGFFSTGEFNGDGYQTSHWKNNSGLGILEPVLPKGEILSISAIDKAALDAIGYDVPELPMIWLFISGILGLSGFKKNSISRICSATINL